jgi:hypothetical protein
LRKRRQSQFVVAEQGRGARDMKALSRPAACLRCCTASIAANIASAPPSR